MTGGNDITLTASILAIALSPAEYSFVCFGICNVCHTDKTCTFQNGGVQSEHVLLDEGSCGISTEWGLGSRIFFSDRGSEENIVDSGKEFVPVDLKKDSSDNDNDILIFITGIHAASRIKLF